MFEFLFKHPEAVYRKGTLVAITPWPLWLLPVAALLGCALLAALYWRKPLPRRRALTLGALECLALALLLCLVWQPAMSVSVLEPQRSVVAVVVDDSLSMAAEERYTAARRLLDDGLLARLRERFPVRLYRAGATLERATALPAQPAQPSTDLARSLRAVVDEAATLPIGAVVLLSDGADNAGGLDSETMAALHRSRIPIHSIGFGSERLAKDVELVRAELPARSLPDARLSATITLRQSGYEGREARLSLTDGSRVLAAQSVKLPADGELLRQTLSFYSGPAGARPLKVTLEPFADETNKLNNVLTSVVNVEDLRPRILYLEGEPRWEMKFIRRAAEEDRSLRLTSILRTSEHKFYRQGIDSPKELERGFPDTVDELFAYQALIIGNVETGTFTPVQQGLIREFIDRRGGSVLLLGGRAALSDGAWNHSPLAELLPVELADRKGTFHRDPAAVDLTAAGVESLLTRLDDDPRKNLARWHAMPYLADYQEVGAAKPGAVVLLELQPTSRGRFPLLTTGNYGRGRVAVFNTGGSWRWRMGLDSKDKSHPVFWRQLLRWLAGEVEGRVSASTSQSVYSDRDRIPLRAVVRDASYLSAPDAVVEAHVLGPGGVASNVTLQAVPGDPGAFAAEWKAEAAGAWLAEIVARQGETELGRDVVTFRREDGVAENFHREQNRELLERIAAQTGGRYWRPAEASRLPSEIEYSSAGITARQTLPIWNAPAVLLLWLALKSAAWLLRRRWGAV